VSSHKCIIKKCEKIHLKTHQENYWNGVSLQTKTTAFIQVKIAVKNAFPHFKVAEIVKYSHSTVFLTQLLNYEPCWVFDQQAKENMKML